MFLTTGDCAYIEFLEFYHTESFHRMDGFSAFSPKLLLRMKLSFVMWLVCCEVLRYLPSRLFRTQKQIQQFETTYQWL